MQQYGNLLRALSARHPLLLTLDDLQWADTGSIGLLFHLGLRFADAGGRILIVSAYRPEELALERDGERHPLEKVLREFKRRFGDVWTDLARADEAQGRRFVEAYLDATPNRLDEGFRRALFERTGGHPLFTVELLQGMQERGDLIQDEDGAWVKSSALDWTALPARVEAVIAERVSRLDEELRGLLSVASVEGERFTAQVVARVQVVTVREVLRALSRELGSRHRLVQERGEVQAGGRFLARYKFAHALFQEYLYTGLSAGERRLLHNEVGLALETLFGSGSDEVVVELAHHYYHSGNVEKAVDYSLRAGEQARMSHANEDAILYYQRVLDLLEPLQAPSRENGRDAWRVAALGGMGQAHYAVGRVAEAEVYLREAVAFGEKTNVDSRDLVRLFFWLGETQWWRGQYDELIRIAEHGLGILEDQALLATRSWQRSR